MKNISKFVLIFFGLLILNSTSNAFAASSGSSSTNIMKSSDYYAAKDLIKKGDYKEAISILKAWKSKHQKIQMFKII